jgi:hypothetical protein
MSLFAIVCIQRIFQRVTIEYYNAIILHGHMNTQILYYSTILFLI